MLDEFTSFRLKRLRYSGARLGVRLPGLPVIWVSSVEANGKMFTRIECQDQIVHYAGDHDVQESALMYARDYDLKASA